MNTLWNSSNCYITVQNRSPGKFQLSEEATPWGYWSNSPALSINQNESISLRLKNDFWLNGVEGYLVYISRNSVKLRLDFSTLNATKSGITLMEGDQTKYSYTFRCKSGGIGENCLGGNDWQYRNCTRSSAQVCIEYTIAAPPDFSSYVIIENASSIRLHDGEGKCDYDNSWIKEPETIIDQKTLSNFSASNGVSQSGLNCKVTYKATIYDRGYEELAETLFVFNFLNSYTQKLTSLSIDSLGINQILPNDGRYSYTVQCRANVYSYWENCLMQAVGSPLYILYTLFDTPLPRKLTANESKHEQEDLPKLDPNNVWVLGEPDRNYNCMAWTVGKSDCWLWPSYPTSSADTTMLEMIGCYKKYGFINTTLDDPQAVINTWGISSDSIKHVSLYYASSYFPNKIWTAKMGQTFLITHKQLALENNTVGYGTIQGAFKSINSPNVDQNLSMLKMKTNDYFSDFQKSHIEKKIMAISPDVVEDFDKLYGNWLNTCAKLLNVFSNIYQCLDLPQINLLQNLGDETIPLYIQKLANPWYNAGFLALVPYSVVQHNISLLSGLNSTCECTQLESIKATELWFTAEHY